MMTKDKKPFTYTPGGIDLSEIKSPRMARRIERNANAPGVGDLPKSPLSYPTGPSSPLPPQALSAMQGGLPVQVFPSGAPPPPPPPPVNAPPPPPPMQPLPTKPVATNDGVFERPDMTRIIPENPMTLLRKTPRVERKSFLDELNDSSKIVPNNRNQQQQQPPQAYTVQSPPTPQNEPKYNAQPQYSPQPTFSPQPQYSPQPAFSPQPQYSPQYTPQPQYSPQPQFNAQQQYSPQPQPQPFSPQPQIRPGMQPRFSPQPMSNQQPQYTQPPPQPQQFKPQQYQNNGDPQELQPVKTSSVSIGSLYIPPINQNKDNKVDSPPSPPQRQLSTPQSPQSPIPKLNAAPKPWQNQKKEQEMPPWAQRGQQSSPPRDEPQPSGRVSVQPPMVVPVQMQPPPPRPGVDVVYVTQPEVYQHPGPGPNQRWVPPPVQKQQQQQQQQQPQQRPQPPQQQRQQSIQEPKGTRIIPIQIEGGGNDRSLERQQSWTPTQSNSFRVLQKMTSTEGNGGDGEPQPVTEHGPRASQHFQQQIPAEHMRRLNMNESDRDFMNRVKQGVDEDKFLHNEVDPRYRGPAIPSKAFRRLQSITDGYNSQNNSGGNQGPRSPQVRTIPVQIEGEEPPQPYVHPSLQTVQEPKKYTGSAIPSRAFKMVQAMTSNALADGNQTSEFNDPSSHQPWNYDNYPYWQDYYPYYYPPNYPDPAESEGDSRGACKTPVPYWPQYYPPYAQKEQPAEEETPEGEPKCSNCSSCRNTPVPFWGYYPGYYPGYEHGEGGNVEKDVPQTTTTNGTNSSRATPVSEYSQNSSRNTPVSYEYQYPYWDPYYYPQYYGYPYVYPQYPPYYPECDGYSSNDEMSFYGKQMQGAQEKEGATPTPTPQDAKEEDMNDNASETTIVDDNDADSESSDSETDDDLYKSATSVTSLQPQDNAADNDEARTNWKNNIQDDANEDAEYDDEDDNSEIADDNDNDDCSSVYLDDDTIPHVLSVIYEESERSDSSRLDHLSRESSVVSDETVIHEEDDDDYDSEQEVVSVKLPLKLTFSITNGNQEVTEVTVGDSEVNSFSWHEDDLATEFVAKSPVPKERRDDSGNDEAINPKISCNGTYTQNEETIRPIQAQTNLAANNSCLPDPKEINNLNEEMVTDNTQNDKNHLTRPNHQANLISNNSWLPTTKEINNLSEEMVTDNTQNDTYHLTPNSYNKQNEEVIITNETPEIQQKNSSSDPSSHAQIEEATSNDPGYTVEEQEEEIDFWSQINKDEDVLPKRNCFYNDYRSTNYSQEVDEGVEKTQAHEDLGSSTINVHEDANSISVELSTTNETNSITTTRNHEDITNDITNTKVDTSVTLYEEESDGVIVIGSDVLKRVEEQKITSHKTGDVESTIDVLSNVTEDVKSRTTITSDEDCIQKVFEEDYKISNLVFEREELKEVLRPPQIELGLNACFEKIRNNLKMSLGDFDSYSNEQNITDLNPNELKMSLGDFDSYSNEKNTPDFNPNNFSLEESQNKSPIENTTQESTNMVEEMVNMKNKNCCVKNGDGFYNENIEGISKKKLKEETEDPAVNYTKNKPAKINGVEEYGTSSKKKVSGDTVSEINEVNGKDKNVKTSAKPLSRQSSKKTEEKMNGKVSEVKEVNGNDENVKTSEKHLSGQSSKTTEEKMNGKVSEEKEVNGNDDNVKTSAKHLSGQANKKIEEQMNGYGNKKIRVKKIYDQKIGENDVSENEIAVNNGYDGQANNASEELVYPAVANDNQKIKYQKLGNTEDLAVANDNQKIKYQKLGNTEIENQENKKVATNKYAREIANGDTKNSNTKLTHSAKNNNKISNNLEDRCLNGDQESKDKHGVNNNNGVETMNDTNENVGDEIELDVDEENINNYCNKSRKNNEEGKICTKKTSNGIPTYGNDSKNAKVKNLEENLVNGAKYMPTNNEDSDSENTSKNVKVKKQAEKIGNGAKYIPINKDPNEDSTSENTSNVKVKNQAEKLVNDAKYMTTNNEDSTAENTSKNVKVKNQAEMLVNGAKYIPTNNDTNEDSTNKDSTNEDSTSENTSKNVKVKNEAEKLVNDAKYMTTNNEDSTSENTSKNVKVKNQAEKLVNGAKCIPTNNDTNEDSSENISICKIQQRNKFENGMRPNTPKETSDGYKNHNGAKYIPTNNDTNEDSTSENTSKNIKVKNQAEKLVNGAKYIPTNNDTNEDSSENISICEKIQHRNKFENGMRPNTPKETSDSYKNHSNMPDTSIDSSLYSTQNNKNKPTNVNGLENSKHKTDEKASPDSPHVYKRHINKLLSKSFTEDCKNVKSSEARNGGKDVEKLLSVGDLDRDSHKRKKYSKDDCIEYNGKMLSLDDLDPNRSGANYCYEAENLLSNESITSQPFESVNISEEIMRLAESRSNKSLDEDVLDKEISDLNNNQQDFYVPTVKERIRALQNASKNSNKKKRVPKEVAEIKHEVYVEVEHKKSKGSIKSLEDTSEDDIDSGVTSDMSRHISDTESEFSELRKMNKYQRAATHSRLFKLLQGICDECDDDDDDGEVEGQDHLEQFNSAMKARKGSLSLPLKASSDYDSFPSSSVNSPSSPISDKLVNELVLSLLRKKKGKALRSLPMKTLQAAAYKILLEDKHLQDDSSDQHLSPLRGDNESSTAAQTPQEFCTDAEYQQYYESWGEANSDYDILPSKVFKLIQEHSNKSTISGFTARCPRVVSSRDLHKELVDYAPEDAESPSRDTSTPIPDNSRHTHEAMSAS